MEAEFLQWLEGEMAKRAGADGDRVTLGIGDDAAVIRTSPTTLCCTEILAQDTHFTLDADSDLSWIGRKALAVNLSDMAAMGARPETALLSLLVNRQQGLAQAQAVTRGLLALANEYQVELVGGDTCSWEGGLVLSVTVLGSPLAAHPLTRSGAQAGDAIFVTGQLGGSLLGRHLNFEPRCREIVAILGVCRPHAVIDISDGLVRDLGHVLTASQVGAQLSAASIPISPAAKKMAEHGLKRSPSPSSQGQAAEPTASSKNRPLRELPAWPDWPQAPQALRHALYDGEDFELLLTMPESEAKSLEQALAAGHVQLDCPLSRIGRIEAVEGLRMEIAEGQVMPLPAGGYQH